MKKKVITMIMITLFLAGIIAVAVPTSAKPSTISLTYHQALSRWQGRLGPFGTWNTLQNNVHISFDYTLTGNVLHTSFLQYVTAKPGTEIIGTSTVYVYDAKAGVWVQKEGTIEYTSPNAPGYLPITVYYRGYLKFSVASDPTSTFVHGAMYSWSYVYGVDEATVKAMIPNAVWDSTMGAWLAGFTIYHWDPTTYTQSYTTPFPSPFIEPVPATNYYNPLGL